MGGPTGDRAWAESESFLSSGGTEVYFGEETRPPANYSFVRLKIVPTERNVTDCPLSLGGLTGMTCSWNQDEPGGKKVKIFSLHELP